MASFLHYLLVTLLLYKFQLNHGRGGYTDVRPKMYTIDVTKSSEENLQEICDDLGDKVGPAFDVMIDMIPGLLKGKYI